MGLVFFFLTIYDFTVEGRYLFWDRDPYLKFHFGLLEKNLPEEPVLRIIEQVYGPNPKTNKRKLFVGMSYTARTPKVRHL